MRTMLINLILASCVWYSPSAQAAEPDASVVYNWNNRFQAWNMLCRQGNFADAERDMLEGLKEAEHNSAASNYVPMIYNNLIVVHYQQNKFKEAKPLFKRYLAAVSARSGENSQEMAKVLQNYAVLLKRLDETKEAEAVEKRSQKIISSTASGGTASGGTGMAPQQNNAPPRVDTKVVEISERDFNNLVLASPTPVVVDFYATWCGPCKMMHPIMKDLAKRFAGQVRFYRMDTDQNPNISGMFRISSIPTFIIFKNGKPVGLTKGARGADEMQNWISKHI